MMRTFVRQLALATFIVGAILWVSPASVLGADPLIGTWKYDPAKSKFSPGPPSKSITVRFEAAGEGVKVTADVVTASDKATHTEYTGNYDGKDYPITGTETGADTVSLKRLDARTTERIDKKGGKVVMTFTRKVSRDGKTLTVTIKGTNPQGQRVNNVVVFVKQP
jgi:hypothetical protein